MVETRVDVAVLGGGFCGLSTAFHLSRAGLSVAVIEKESELAGLARSHQLDDYSIEVFYHHYFTHDEDVISMLSVLGLGDRFVTRRASQGIFSAGRRYPFSTPIDLLSFPNIPFRERLKLGLVSQKLLGARDDLEALSAKDMDLQICWSERLRESLSATVLGEVWMRRNGRLRRLCSRAHVRTRRLKNEV